MIAIKIIDTMALVELRQLEYFVAVAAEMNFSRAAHQVHVVQSALSTSVGKLEKELGVELFDRSRQQIKLTPAGELFLEHARRVIHAARLARDSVSDYQGQLSGTVEFGSLVSFGTLDLPRILGEFHRAHPFVRIALQQNTTGSLTYLSAIADGTLDLALVSAPDRFPADVEMQILAEEPMLFVCRPDHPLAERKHLAIPDLAGEDLLGFPPQFGLRRVIDHAFAQVGITARTPYEVANDLTFAANLVRNGLGSVFMPGNETPRFPDLTAVPLSPAVNWPIFLAWAKGERLRPASAKLAELLLQSAGRDTRRLSDTIGKRRRS
jgi:DNA-binding transcriptional LysR family regulator